MIPLLLAICENPVTIRSNRSLRLNGTLLQVSFGLVQAVHVQQIVQQVQDMFALRFDIFQMVIPAFPVPGIFLPVRHIRK